MSQRKVELKPIELGFRFLAGTFVFFSSVCLGTYFLQSTLILLQNFGLYAHWAAILIVLPAIAGLIQHLLNTPARIIVALLGALISTLVLFPFYSGKFWAIPPSITDTIVFTFAVGGIGFSFSINPLERHAKPKRRRRTRKTDENSDENSNDLNQEKHIETSTSDKILNSSLIKSLELLLTVLSFVLAIWGTFFLGSSSFE